MLRKTYTLFFLFLLLFCSTVVNADEDFIHLGSPLYVDNEGKIFYKVENNTFTMEYNVEYIIDSSSVYNIIDIPLPLIKGGVSFNESNISTDYYNNNLSISILPNKPIGLSENYDIDRFIQFDETSYYLTVGNLQAVEGTVLTIDLLFTPKQEEGIVYFVEKMDTVTVYYATVEENLEDEVDFPYTIFLLPIVAMVCYILTNFIYNRSEERRVRRAMRRRVDPIYTRAQSTLEEDLLRLRQRNNRPFSSKETFTCKTTDLREFVDGEGLFRKGIKKFDVLPYEEQVEKIRDLSEVKEYQSNDKSVLVDLGRYGKYYYKVMSAPNVYRIESDGYISDRNPYIGSGYNLCLGDALHTYNRCYTSKNYLECIRVINEVLKSRHGHGFRSWSDCGL